MEYHGVAMGGKIYSLRAAKGMTQEQLAVELCISPAAVSKWERNLANPNIEMLWALADFFDCTIDELVGRGERKLERVGEYDRERLRLAETAAELVTLSNVSRQKGLLALEEEVARYEGGSSFLPFAVRYLMKSLLRQLEPERVVRLLENYVTTLPEQEQAEGRMIVEVLGMIVSGERPELIQETTASHVGMGYFEKIEGMEGAMPRKRKRGELMERYREKKLFSERTALLEEFVQLGDFEIQVVLRNLDNATLTAALRGASGSVVIRFLANLSDRVLIFVCEDIERWEGTEKEIVDAQKRVLELSRKVMPGEGVKESKK